MKSSKDIIKHLNKNPLLSNLNKAQCYAKFASLLPKNMQDGIAFMYQKNDTLFFVLKHQAYKMEFDYKLNLIKGLLKTFISFEKDCILDDVLHIKFFVTHKQYSQEKPISPLDTYYEKSDGNFTNNLKNEKLHSLFEQIKDIIKCSKTS